MYSKVFKNFSKDSNKKRTLWYIGVEISIPIKFIKIIRLINFCYEIFYNKHFVFYYIYKFLRSFNEVLIKVIFWIRFTF